MKKISIIFFILNFLFSVSGASRALASPPDFPYMPGEVSIPACSPGSPNCHVVTPAVSGENEDITSLSGLTTPLSVLQGGTGEATAAEALNSFLPSQNFNSGKFLTTDGDDASWGVPQISWGDIIGDISDQLDLDSFLSGLTADLSDLDSNLDNTIDDLADLDSELSTALLDIGGGFSDLNDEISNINSSISGFNSALSDLETKLNSDISDLTTDININFSNINDTFADVDSALSDMDIAIAGKEPNITAGTNSQYWRGDKSWQTLDKSAVGLSSVENTALSTWTGSTNLTTLGNISSGTWNGTAIAVDKGGTGQTTLPNALNALLPSQTSNNGKFLTTDGSVASWGSPSGVAWGSITGTLSNQTDLNSALSGKEPTITAGSSSQYWRGDKTFQTLDKSAVGLGSVENTALSTWAGSTNITTLGTISSGTWSGANIAINKGGTNGTAAPAAGAVAYGTGSAYDFTAAGSSGQVLRSAGTSTPTWSTATYPSTASTAGNHLRSDGTNFVSTAATSSQSAPADPATTTSATGVMMGLAGSITPVSSGKVMIIISGDIDNNTLGNGAQVRIRYGTGGAPANGAALTGTTAGGLQKVFNPSLALLTPGRFAFSVNAVVTGLSPNTAYWLDLELAALSGGTARVRDISISVIEL